MKKFSFLIAFFLIGSINGVLAETIAINEQKVYTQYDITKCGTNLFCHSKTGKKITGIARRKNKEYVITNGVIERERRLYKSGKIEEDIPIVNGKRHGLYKEYYETGELRKEGNYQDGEKAGLAKTYYETGELEAELVYVDGSVVQTKSYNKDGKIKDTYAPLYPEDPSSQIHKKYDKNGKVSEIIKYTNFHEEIYRAQYWNGNLQSETYAENGITYEKDYHTNGALKKVAAYKNTKKEGSHETYYANGQLELKISYHNDTMVDGDLIWFHENGKIKTKLPIHNGQIADGTYVFYSDTEPVQVVSEITFKNGTRYIEREYYPNKKIKKEDSYFFSPNDYDKNFRLEPEYPFLNGAPSEVKEFDETGILKTKTIYPKPFSAQYTIQYFDESGKITNEKEIDFQKLMIMKK